MYELSDYLFIIPIAIAAVLGVMSPGPSFLFVAQTALNKSRSHGIATSLGMGTGAVIFTLLASFGLFVIIENVPVLYGVLKFIGGLYLLFLAYRMWKTSNEPISHETQTIDNSGYIRSYSLGLLTQLSNPKTAIVIGSVIMTFLPLEVPPYSFWIIAIMTFIIDSGWYCIVSIALTTQKAQRVYQGFKKIINRLASGLMALMGGKLILNP